MNRFLGLAIVLILLAAGAIALVTAGNQGEPKTTAVTVTPATGIVVTFRCTKPGSGWTEVVTWRDIADDQPTISHSSSDREDWQPVTPTDDEVRREGVPAGELSYYRFSFSGPQAKPDLFANAQAPDHAC